ncbi:hypothetical protein EON65_50255 [archaeon]|nr:MAG: hypothetical protein EON65_50255 [archaeon]
MNGDKELEEREAHATLERKISIMRERFMKLQSLQQPDDAGDADIDIPPDITSSTPKESVATQRWNKIRMVVRSNKGKRHLQVNMTPGSPSLSSSSFFVNEDSSPRGSPRSNAGNSPRSPRTPRVSLSAKSVALGKALEMEDINLLPLWNDDSQIREFNFQNLKAPSLVITDDAQTDEEDFVKGTIANKMDLYRIPEEVVEERKNAIEEIALLEKKNAVESIKKAHIDVIHREHLGRNRVQKLEQKVRDKQRKEREKLIQLAREKESQIALQFRKAREDLEAGIRRQHGSVKEDFGSLLIHEESIARRFRVFYRMVPQPMEVSNTCCINGV